MNDYILDNAKQIILLVITLSPIYFIIAWLMAIDKKEKEDISKDNDEINTEDTDTADTADTEKTNLSLEKYDNFYKKWLSNDDDDKEEK